MKKTLEYYKNLHYPIRIEADPEGGFVASHPDLDGCFGAGETHQEAIEDLEDSKNLWLESYYAAHHQAPEPRLQRDYSGKFLLRVPKYLHQRLNDSAAAEGVSLNLYIVALLSERDSLNQLTGLFEDNQAAVERLAQMHDAGSAADIVWAGDQSARTSSGQKLTAIH